MEHRLMHKPHVSSTSYISCESILYNEDRCNFHTIETSNNTILKIWQFSDIQRIYHFFVLYVAQG